MYKNYVKIALRLFWKNKAFSIINITGLAISMAVCLLLIILVKDANEYDNWHPGGERVYRINTNALRKEGGRELYASSPFIVGATIASSHPDVEAWTNLNNSFSADIISSEKRFRFRGMFADSSFFSVFGYTLKSGKADQVLRDPFTMIVSEELAEKLFPGENPVGKTVEVQERGLFTINGVLNKSPGKSHLEFEALLSTPTTLSLENTEAIGKFSKVWQNYYVTYNYIKIKPGAGITKLIATLQEIGIEKYKNLPLESRDRGYEFQLQPLHSITPGPMMSNNMGRGLPVAILWFLTILALIIIISAAFNYTNLTIARAMSRMKEIALRKVVGSSRRHIFMQVTVESVVTSLAALLLAIVILQFLIPPFSRLSIFSMADINFQLDATVLLLFLCFALLVGFIAGLVPASVLSGVRPLMLLQKLQNLKLLRRLGLRKALLVFQFMISLVFIIMVTITYKQMQHAVNINFGTRQSHIFNIQLQGQDYIKARQEFSKVPGVENISAISILMGSYQDWKVDVKTTKDKDPIGVRQYFIDDKYISNLNLELIAGNNFSDEPGQKSERFIIVNETFLKNFRLGDPLDAVGKTVLVADSIQLSVKGVVKDFLFKPAEYNLEPMMLRYDTEQLAILNVAVSSGGVMKTAAELENIWKKLDPIHPFEGKFYKEQIQSMFAEMQEVIWVVAFIAFLGITIACLGLLGITMFMVQSKVKEISIRKVVGAGPASIVRILSRSYIQVMLFSFLIGIPIAGILGNIMLQTINQHINLSVGLFIPGLLIITLLSVLTIGTQTLKAAFLNPVKGLREE